MQAKTEVLKPIGSAYGGFLLHRGVHTMKRVVSAGSFSKTQGPSLNVSQRDKPRQDLHTPQDLALVPSLRYSE